MRIRWRDFEIPNSVICEEATRKASYAKFLIEPFEQGFGTTVGNGLRRILLSSLEGAAVVSAKIEGVQHEFSSLTGVYEDVTDIVLNLKTTLLTLHDVPSAELRIRKDKKGPVLAADIQHGPDVEVVNPDLLIATLTEDIPFNVDLLARKGRGYLTAEENSRGDNEIGVIWLDASFSPVSRVRYKVESTRVGQRTNFDCLNLEVWTNGTVRPDLALVEAAKILRRHLNPFLQYADLGFQLQRDGGMSGEDGVVREDTGDLREKLDRPVSSLGLSVRALNCLEGEGIRLVGEVVARTEADLLKVRNFGKTTLGEITETLETLGLRLGMEVPALENSAGNVE